MADIVFHHDDDLIYMGTTKVGSDEIEDLPLPFWMESGDHNDPPPPSPPRPARVATPPAEDDDLYKCVISGDYMHDPVHAADGFPYEHEHILRWLNFGENAHTAEVKSPRTNQPMAKFIFRSFDYYKNYKAWCERTGHPMPIATTTFGLLLAPAPAPAPSHRPAPPAPSAYRLNCTDVGMGFTLLSTYDLSWAERARDQTLRQRLEQLTAPAVLDLVIANTGTLPSTRTKTWCIAYLVWAVKAHERCGLRSLEGRGQYYLPFFSGGGGAGVERLLVSSTPSVALQLFLYTAPKPLKHIFTKLTVDELEDFVVWNSTDAGVFNDFPNIRTKTAKVDRLCNLLYATCLAP